MTASLVTHDLTKHFGATVAVDGVDLQVDGGVTALVGPSGCGKSTTLHLVAGVEQPDQGRILADGVDLTGRPAERRPVTLVSQKALLFPHLDVGQNVGFGLRMRRVPRADAARRVEEALEQVGLSGFAGRAPRALSGGQEQRVALARALVVRPSILLLDEPFSALDPGLRAEMRDLVRALLRDSGVTTLFVTHDLDEAVDVADHLVVMLDGRVAARGTPETVFTDPRRLDVARFLGAGNELLGRAVDGVVEVAGHRLDPAVVGSPATDGPVVVTVHPGALRTAPPGSRGLPVRVEGVRFAATHLRIDARTDDGQVLVVDAPLGTHVPVGDRVELTIDPGRARAYPRSEG
ncbi:ABC transporter, ATP-binding protein [Aeromicrobium marinum DSM 15272]|uniref:ABC-type quaternary amine transporter n=1 Tax=Aeromicrobium marinum DSM 15272 TaxID=585531 RepID=E2SEY7_9ACTN|nr:ABC transporter ATP-binding protein [Aeromicrobium marinum]EFQ82231.1 ABC transporter, ATP-binding protein [Aeromicrobium marinum DSM 15272]